MDIRKKNINNLNFQDMINLPTKFSKWNSPVTSDMMPHRAIYFRRTWVNCTILAGKTTNS